VRASERTRIWTPTTRALTRGQQAYKPTCQGDLDCGKAFSVVVLVCADEVVLMNEGYYAEFGFTVPLHITFRYFLCMPYKTCIAMPILSKTTTVCARGSIY